MKTVLITGATSGIGLGCARKFAQNGDRLILTGRNTEKLTADPVFSVKLPCEPALGSCPESPVQDHIDPQGDYFQRLPV